MPYGSAAIFGRKKHGRLGVDFYHSAHFTCLYGDLFHTPIPQRAILVYTIAGPILGILKMEGGGKVEK